MNLITNGEEIIFSNELNKEYFYAPSTECMFNLSPMNISLDRFENVYIVCDPSQLVEWHTSMFFF